MDDDILSPIAQTRCWVKQVVIGLNLCPFARREWDNDTIRYTLSEADSAEALLMALAGELQWLREHEEVETTLLIHPKALTDFSDYNDFLGVCDALLADLGLEGEFQIASFHPEYQFAGTDICDVENYSNRAPYPMLHLLREASVESAVAGYPEVERVPERNIARLREQGLARMQQRLQACRRTS